MFISLPQLKRKLFDVEAVEGEGERFILFYFVYILLFSLSLSPLQESKMLMHFSCPAFRAITSFFLSLREHLGECVSKKGGDGKGRGR